MILFNFLTAEWWIHFGQSAPNLKSVAICILFQTVSSSGCERNWFNFCSYSQQTEELPDAKRMEQFDIYPIQSKAQLEVRARGNGAEVW